MLTESDIKGIIDTIIVGYQPEKIILFGSYANGQPNEDSDLDIFIIKKTKARRIQRGLEVHSLFQPYPFPMDIIIYTPREYNKKKKIFGSLPFIIQSEGKVVYEN